jgi:hypothetical protein
MYSSINNKMQRYTMVFITKMLYMFQVVPSPIIRSSKLYTRHPVFVELLLLLIAIVSEFQLQLTHDSGKKQNDLNRYPVLCHKNWVLKEGSGVRLKTQLSWFCVYCGDSDYMFRLCSGCLQVAISYTKEKKHNCLSTGAVAAWASPAQDATAIQPDTPRLYTPAKHTPLHCQEQYRPHMDHTQQSPGIQLQPQQTIVSTKIPSQEIRHVTINYNNEISLIII